MMITFSRIILRMLINVLQTFQSFAETCFIFRKKIVTIFYFSTIQIMWIIGNYVVHNVCVKKISIKKLFSFVICSFPICKFRIIFFLKVIPEIMQERINSIKNVLSQSFPVFLQLTVSLIALSQPWAFLGKGKNLCRQ